MKAEELTVLDGTELADRLKQSRRELYELRFQLAVGQLEDHRQVRKVKKDIARILTVIRGRELAEHYSPAEVQKEASSPLAGGGPAPTRAEGAAASADDGGVREEAEE